MLQGVIVKNTEVFAQHCQDWFLSVLFSFLLIECDKAIISHSSVEEDLDADKRKEAF